MVNKDPKETFITGSRHFELMNVRGSTTLLSLIGMYIVLVPTFSFISCLGFFNEKRVLQIGVLIAVACGLLMSWAARQQWLKTFCRLPLAARWGLSGVLGLGLLSSALAPAPFYAFLEVGHFVLLFAAAGIVASEVRRAPSETQWAFLGIVAVSGGLYATYFGFGYIAHLSIPGIDPWPEWGTNYANIRLFNHYQTWTLPLFAGVVLSIPKRWRFGKGIMFGVTSLWWALVLVSNVRGTVVAMGIASIGVVLLFRSQAKKWLVVQGLALVAGTALFYILFSEGSSLAEGAPPVTEKFGQGSPGRLQSWTACLDMMWADPILGAGPMHFAWLPYQSTGRASPHSALMQWLAEWGVPSTLIMVGLAIWGGWKWISQERDSETTDVVKSKGLSVALVASVLAGAAHSMVSGLIAAPLSQMLLVFVGGWIWGRYRFARERRTHFETRSKLWSHSILCVVAAGSMFVLGASLQDLTDTEERREAFLETVDRNRLSPRYWTQGYIEIRDPSVVEQIPERK